MEWGDHFIYPNMWVLLVGASGVRKTSAMNIANGLLSEVRGATVFPSEFSREALMDILKANGSGSFMLSEFSQFMGMMRANYNDGVLGLLTEIFDVPENYKRVTRGGGSMALHRPCVNILACSTPEFMSANEAEWMSGFGPRFLLVHGAQNRYMPIPKKVNRKEKSALIAFLQHVRGIEGEVSLSNPRRYAEWSHKTWERSLQKSALERSWNSRIQIYAIKLAMLIELSAMSELWREPGKKQNLLIRESSLERAVKMVTAIGKSLVDTYEESSVVATTFSKDQKRVLGIIQSLGADALWRKILQRSHMSTKVLKVHIDTLIESGAVVATKVDQKRGSTLHYAVVHRTAQPTPEVVVDHIEADRQDALLDTEMRSAQTAPNATTEQAELPL